MRTSSTAKRTTTFWTAGAGADIMVGGDGTDTADYSVRLAAVSVDPEDVAGGGDDGEASEGDGVLADVERVLGGHGPDTLTGGPGPQTLVGGDGADRLTGGPEADVLDGGFGEDTLDSADDAVDQDRCGLDADVVAADVLDSVDPDCETVSRPPPGGGVPAPGVGPPGAGAPGPGGAPGAAPGPTPSLTVSLSASTITLTPRGVVGLPIACPPGGRRRLPGCRQARDREARTRSQCLPTATREADRAARPDTLRHPRREQSHGPGQALQAQPAARPAPRAGQGPRDVLAARPPASVHAQARPSQACTLRSLHEPRARTCARGYISFKRSRHGGLGMTIDLRLARVLRVVRPWRACAERRLR